MEKSIIQSHYYAPRVAGILFIALIFFHFTGNMLFDYNSIPNDLSNTLNDITDHHLKAYSSFLLLLSAHWGAIVLAVMLYIILKPYDPNLAFMALTFRLAEGFSGLYGDTHILNLFDLSRIYVENSVDATSLLYSAEMNLRTFINATIGGIGAITFGIGSLIYNILFLKSRYVPQFISILGITASAAVILGMMFQMAGVGGTFIGFIWIPMLISELILGFWLAVKGVKNYYTVSSS